MMIASGWCLLSVVDISECQKDEEELASNVFDLEKTGRQETKLRTIQTRKR